MIGITIIPWHINRRGCCESVLCLMWTRISLVYCVFTTNCYYESQSVPSVLGWWWTMGRFTLMQLFPAMFWQSFDRCIEEDQVYIVKSDVILWCKWDVRFKGCNMLPSPPIALFGRSTEDSITTNVHTNVIAFTSLIARRGILLFWKLSLPLSPKP